MHVFKSNFSFLVHQGLIDGCMCLLSDWLAGMNMVSQHMVLHSNYKIGLIHTQLLYTATLGLDMPFAKALASNNFQLF